MAGADVRVGVRRLVVRVGVEEPVVIVAVIVAADVKGHHTGIGVDIEPTPGSDRAENPDADYSIRLAGCGKL